MRGVVKFAKSSVGAKALMAVSGVALFGFVIAHMLGNLQVFMGPEALNSYAALLQSQKGLLWTARAGLLAFVLLHIFSAIRLSALNKAARPVAYAYKTYQDATLASRTMMYTGLVVLAFILYHLAHFTLGMTHPEHHGLIDAQGRHDVYAMVIMGFRQPLVSAFYILAMVLLGFHLNHGASSMFQSLGLNSAKYRPFISKIGPTVAIIIVLGNISMPLAILMGLVGGEVQ